MNKPVTWTWRMAWTLSLVALCAAGLTGCVTKIEPSEEWPAPLEPDAILQAGDTVSVKFAYWPELDTKQAIRPDGKITLAWLGDIDVAGKTPEAVSDELQDVHYKDKLKFRGGEREIAVIIDGFDSRRVFVGGEVHLPGLQPLGHKTTVLEAIMTAGGPIKESAKLDRVIVIRNRGGKQYTQTVDIKKAIRQPETQTFELEPRDIVIVPRTGIDRVDQWVEQYVNKIIPRSVYFNLTHPIGPDQSVDSTSTNFSFPVPTTAK
jgi:polysaccharide export outer membrane protein